MTFIHDSFSDGQCIDMILRCNTIVDCADDEADETDCQKVTLTETYNRDAAPNTGVDINGNYVVNKV